MAKPWSKPKSWALESELAESEELATPPPPSQNFPSLKEAASSKPKKKKPAPIPLTEFYAATSTPDELLNLPTAPRERRPEDSDRSGGFGYQRRGFEHDTRNVPQKTRAFEPDLPSRADEVSDWGAGKKPFSGFDRPRNDRYGSLGGGSRSDEVGNWAAGKKEFVRNDRYEMLGGNSKASEVDNWAAGKKEFARNDRYEMLGGNSKAGEVNNWAAARKPVQSLPSFNNGERKKLVLDPPKKNGGSKSDSRSNVFGMARPREEVLAEKGLDWKKIDLELESKTSRPSSAHSSRPGSSGSQAGSGRVKVNPFGDAKPREVVLMEKGVDYRKIDMELEHKRVDSKLERRASFAAPCAHALGRLCAFWHRAPLVTIDTRKKKTKDASLGKLESLSRVGGENGRLQIGILLFTVVLRFAPLAKTSINQADLPVKSKHTAMKLKMGHHQILRGGKVLHKTDFTALPVPR